MTCTFDAGDVSGIRLLPAGIPAFQGSPAQESHIELGGRRHPSDTNIWQLAWHPMLARCPLLHRKYPVGRKYSVDVESLSLCRRPGLPLIAGGNGGVPLACFLGSESDGGVVPRMTVKF